MENEFGPYWDEEEKPVSNRVIASFYATPVPEKISPKEEDYWLRRPGAYRDWKTRRWYRTKVKGRYQLSEYEKQDLCDCWRWGKRYGMVTLTDLSEYYEIPTDTVRDILKKENLL